MPDPSASLKGRWVAWLITLPLLSFGAYTLWAGYAPERNTRYGPAAALYGSDAERFGVFIMLLAILPLLMYARKETVGWLATLMFVAIMASVAMLIYW